jgi:hypothetical protein
MIGFLSLISIQRVKGDGVFVFPTPDGSSFDPACSKNEAAGRLLNKSSLFLIFSAKIPLSSPDPLSETF